MNIIEAFVAYMTAEGLGALGTDIFIGSAPIDAGDPIWWVMSSGGTSNPKNSTGERIKNYVIDVYYRNTDAQDVYDQLQAFEEIVNSKNCTQLAGYDTLDIEALLFPVDRDIDNEDRTVGQLQVTASVYQS